MYVRSYKPGELSGDLAVHGKDYIVQRFKDVWGIDRSDEITLDSIHGRRNLIALEGSEVIGWLGVNEDGELVNGCSGPGHSSYILIMLLKHLFQDSPSQSSEYYAFVPIDYLASAACCIKSGMHLPESIPAEFVAKAYGNKVVTLIKLIYKRHQESAILDTKQSQRERLARLKLTIKEYAKPSKPRQFLKLLIESRKRLTDPLSFLSLHLGIDADLALKQFSIIPTFLLSALFSLLYYILALHILGRDVPTYWNFLTQGKSEQDREELIRYLEISKDALKRMGSHVDSNNKDILDYIGTANNDEFHSSSQAKIILKKQETSIELLEKIFDTYSNNLKDGIDSGIDSIQKYKVVLYYMSKAPPYTPADFNKLADKDILGGKCVDEDCVGQKLRNYVEGASTR